MNTEMIKQESVKMADVANGLVVRNEYDFKSGVSMLEMCKSGIDIVEDVLGGIKGKAFEAYKEASNLYKRASEGYEQADEVLRAKLKAYLESRKTDPDDPRLYYREDYEAEVTDIMGLIQDVLDKKVSAEVLKINQPALNKLAKSAKEFLNIRGVIVKRKKILCFKPIKEEQNV